jgi:branched-chain amino acid transport system permease protein
VRVWSLHLALILALALALTVLPPYPATMLARILVLAVFAMGYNLAFGYTGLLSLGHAVFLAAGVYAAGLAATGWGIGAGPALVLGTLAGGLAALLIGLLALRTAGVSFMIVTLMFAQAGYLTVLYFGPVTGGDEGFNLPATARSIAGFDLSTDAPRFVAALCLFAVALLASLMIVRSPFGRSMVAMRENEERSRMLGLNPFAVKLAVLAVSGLYAGAAGAAYAVLFGYAGANFATIQYSILPMLYVLLGGAGTTLGPFLGALLMVVMIELASRLGRFWPALEGLDLFLVGAALVVLVLFAPRGILGTVRERWVRWLP